MPDNTYPYQTSEPFGCESDGSNAFQFSLIGLFIVTTVLAMIFSLYFGVGRWLGMSTMEVLQQGLTRFLYFVPTMLVWIVGLAVALRHLKCNRGPAMLTSIAMLGMIVASIVVQVAQMALIHLINSGRISASTISWGLGISGFLFSIVNAVGWILVLVAVFRRRPRDVGEPKRFDEGESPFAIGNPHGDYGVPRRQ